MQIVIDIPKEFETHFNTDKFNESLNRVIYDIEQCNRHGSEYDALSGNYEIETLKMLRDSFANGTPLPKEHGRLIDVDAFIAREECCGYIEDMDADYFNSVTPTIIEPYKTERKE